MTSKGLDPGHCPLDERSLDLRQLVVDTLAASRRGHLGSTFSLLEIMRVLYDHVLRHDPQRPKWPERDRCILSKGHGCLAQYVLLADHGYFPKEELNLFCQAEGILGGHPDWGKVPGIEASTGSLGHGLALGVGRALACRMDGRSSRVFVVLGDGECNEGSVWEAALSAAKHRLDNLVVIVDYNRMQSSGPTQEIFPLEPFADKWKSFGLATKVLNGHAVDQLESAFKQAPLVPGQPTCFICLTIKGKGIDFAEQNLSWHHKSKITDQDLADMRQALRSQRPSAGG